jgi:hypothetical protein
VAGHATRIALRELGRRAQFLDRQLERLDELIVPLVTARAPGLLAIYGAGPRTVALLLIAAGDHPGRLRSEAAWAHLCGAAPIPASSGKVTRHRLNPGGDRQANHALWRIVFTRLGSDPATRAYAERRTAEGKSKAEIIRCLKRYVARGVPPPAPGCRVTPESPGDGLTRYSAAANLLACERFVGRPRPHLTCWACPNKSLRAPSGAAHPCLVRKPAITGQNTIPKPQNGGYRNVIQSP